MFSTTEITSHEDISDNVIHQRLFFAYVKAAELIKGTVLEIGCGAGRGLDVILTKADEYTAVDKNGQLMEHLQSKYPKGHFLHSHIPPLKEIEDERFEWVISFQVIEHIKNDRLFLQEIHRVLKKGGKAIITTPNRPLSLTRNPWHVREYTANELEKLGKTYFEQVNVKSITGSERVMQYYRENRESVKKITRFDVLNLQYRLPRQLLQVPYEVLNRMNRRSLMNGNNQLVSEITTEDYFLTENNTEEGFDLFCVMTK